MGTIKIGVKGQGWKTSQWMPFTICLTLLQRLRAEGTEKWIASTSCQSVSQSVNNTLKKVQTLGDEQIKEEKEQKKSCKQSSVKYSKRKQIGKSKTGG